MGGEIAVTTWQLLSYFVAREAPFYQHVEPTARRTRFRALYMMFSL